MKLFYQYMAIFSNCSPTASHLHPLQVENCDRNSRLVVDEDDNGYFRLERVNNHIMTTRIEKILSLYLDIQGQLLNIKKCNNSHVYLIIFLDVVVGFLTSIHKPIRMKMVCYIAGCKNDYIYKKC